MAGIQAAVDYAGARNTRALVIAQGGHVVFGEGNPAARVLFVGSGYGQFSQAPGNVLLAFRPKGK